MAEWCLIESDPGVFTELVSGMGVQGVQVEELYDLSTEGLSALAPVYGLVFLFKWQQGAGSDPSTCIQHEVPGLYFARQVIQNACATQAILNVLLNCPDVDLGSELRGFKEFTQSLPPDMRGLAISNSENMRAVHNSFSRQETFTMESRKATDDDDLYHFLGYVPFAGRLYELDGLNTSPIDHGPCEGGQWLSRASDVIRERIARYSQGEIRFNLMAIAKDRKQVCEEKIRLLEERIARLNEPDAMNTEESGVSVASLEEEIATLRDAVGREDRKREQCRVENVRRKHNYIPLFLEALRQLARTGQLSPIMEEAKRKQAERVAREHASA